MKNIFEKIIFVSLFFVFVGCAGNCIKVGAGYEKDGKKISGDLQYCLDKPASEKAGETVLTNRAGDRAILLTAPDAYKIVELLEKDQAGAKSVENIFVQLRKKLLQEYK